MSQEAKPSWISCAFAHSAESRLSVTDSTDQDNLIYGCVNHQILDMGLFPSLVTDGKEIACLRTLRISRTLMISSLPNNQPDYCQKCRYYTSRKD
ncbi:hypothetical protein M1563_03055 [Patescibacteria group bacterium]|nr:hypothetical protein [Patescibacteria group bacterium]MCL5409806.1 hypothetical protein [Patescibacteria group bacterium]